MFDGSIKREWLLALMEARRLLVSGLRRLDREEYIRGGTIGSCPAAAMLLYATMLKHDPDSCPVIKQGIYSAERYQSAEHFWIHARDKNSVIWNLDVSADQFGEQRLVCFVYDPEFPFTVYHGPTDLYKHSWLQRDLQLINENDPSPQVRIERVCDLYFSDPKTGLIRTHCLPKVSKKFAS
jgi:hypothetical protein